MPVKWTAPEGTIVVWSVDAPHSAQNPALLQTAPGHATAFEDLNEHCAHFMRRFELSFAESSYIHTRLDDPRWRDIIAVLRDPVAARGVFMRSCWLEEPKPPQDDPALWFELDSVSAEMRSLARPPKNAHVVSYEVEHRVYTTLFSEALCEFILASKLRGLETLPMVQSKPSDPVIWREAFASVPLGRGLHHPLIDESERVAQYDFLVKPQHRPTLHPAWKRGEPTASLDCFHKDASLEPPLMRTLIEMCPKTFRVHGPERAVREFLPSTDFAYRGWEYRPPETKGKSILPRRRRICCNAAVRTALLRSGLVKKSQFTPIVIVDEARAFAEVFDRTITSPLPPPAYTAEEAQREQAERTQAIRVSRAADTDASTPHTVPTLMAELHRRLATSDTAWKPLREYKLLAEIQASPLFSKTPVAWQQLLPLLPESVLCMDLDFEFNANPPEQTTWLDGILLGGDDNASERPLPDDIEIARTLSGNWFAIRPSDPLMPNDAAVIQWNHENLLPGDHWPSICAFVQHIIESRDRAIAVGEDPD